MSKYKQVGPGKYDFDVVEQTIRDTTVEAKHKQIGGSHYKHMPIQPTEFIVQNGIGWCGGNAIKYICRYHLKGGTIDIDKAIHYLELLREEIDNGTGN